MADAKAKKTPKSYVQNVVRFAKAANSIFVHNQLVIYPNLQLTLFSNNS